MKDETKNIRNVAVLFVSCLLCVILGMLMGLSMSAASG